MNRRKFIKSGSLLLAAGSLSAFDVTKVESFEFEDSIQGPVILSTWVHGLEANRAAWKVIEKGGSALDATIAGAIRTESDLTNRSVGIGGRPDRTGHVTLDACVMDGDGRSGSVGFLEGIAHPAAVAKAVMEKTPHAMLVGSGAKQFALNHGFDTIKTPIPEVKQDYLAWKKENKDLLKRPKINHENHDTIGLIARDANGNFGGTCTTSGWAYKMPGRLGDSPIIGAGLFVDNEVGAATATGLGEAIIRVAGSAIIVELMRGGMKPADACKEVVMRIIRKNKDLTGLQCGFIAMDKLGNIGGFSVYNGFNFALKTKDRDEMVDVDFDRKW
ncbi:MAG: isoaspartyl peptidase/L-asparaginase family protein [Flavobacteriales bacterium]